MSAHNTPINPGRRQYPIQIDETTYSVEGPVILGRTILELAQKDSEMHFVTQIIVGADDIVVEPDDKVDISTPGKERFTIVAKSKKPCQVIVNTHRHDWDARTISFEQVVSWAFPDWRQDDPNTTEYTVTYDCGVPEQPEGSLVAGSSVKVRCGMVFDVDRTNRS
jgi:hypothetical protein